MATETKTTEKPFGVDPGELLSHQHGLGNSMWAAWFLVYRYASDHGLLNRDIEAGTDKAEQQMPVSDRQLAAANKVVRHAAAALGLHW